MSLLLIHRHSCLIFSLLAISVSVVGCSYIFPEKDDKQYLAKKFLHGADFPRISYTADLETIGDQEFDEYFKSLLRTLNKEILPPISGNALRYRADMDLKILRKALKNKGYFMGKAAYTCTPNEKGNRHIHFTVTTGPRYKVGNVSIAIDDLHPSHAASPENFFLHEKAEKVINIPTGEPVDLDGVIESMLRLQKYFQGKGYYCVEVFEPLGKIDDATQKVTLEYKIILNGKKKLGPIHLSGLKTIDEIYVLNRLRLKTGEDFDTLKVDKAQRELLNTELFSSIIMTPSTTCDPERDKFASQEELPLQVDLIEAPPRSIGGGIRYATVEGIGGRLFWQHRNLAGKGEKISVKMEASQIQYSLKGIFEKPDFYWTDVTFEAKADATRAETKAFWGDILGAYLGIKHRYNDQLVYQVGSRYEYSRLKQNKDHVSSFVALPFSALYDQSNDVVNPYKGWKVKADITPFVGDIGNHGYMTKISLFASSYIRLMKKDNLVLAVWCRGGHISSSSLQNIPLNKRFYSGGSNSVRGYGFQKLGPIGTNGRPTGGESQWEMGIEPRVRIGENYGVSVFAEAGRVFSSTHPKNAIRRKSPSEGGQFRKGEVLIGYGVGIKYYTDIGPLRLDVAFPTKVRHHHKKRYDAPFQFYLSIGQAF